MMAAFNLKSEGVNLADFCIGKAHFATPRHIEDGAIDAIEQVTYLWRLNGRDTWLRRPFSDICMAAADAIFQCLFIGKVFQHSPIRGHLHQLVI
jgi:hypothetical protein